MTAFTGFDNTTSPVVGDYLVGYGVVGIATTEKRFTVNQVLTFVQNNISITRLAGTSDNYIQGTGSAAGAGTAAIAPAGADAAIELLLAGKGASGVTCNSVLTMAANIDLNGNDLQTNGGDVLTAGGAINTANGSVTLGAGNLVMASGTITLTAGDIVISSGDLTLSGAGTLDINGGSLKTDTIAVSLAGSITVADNMIVGVGAANKVVTTSGITGNKDAPAAGDEPPDLVLSGIVEMDDETFTRDKAYFDSDVMSQTYLRGSAAIGLTADVSSVQGGGLINKQFNQYATVANLGDCATLPALAAEGYANNYRYPFMCIVVRNDGAQNMDVFPNTGGTINGGAADAAVAVAAGAQTTFYGVESGGVDTWFTVN